MKTVKTIITVLMVALFLAGCGAPEQGTQTTRLEQEQQSNGVEEIVRNQPVPSLNGYSQEREIVIETIKARNRNIVTYTYMVLENGMIIEICPSIASPIPYSTQLTNPLMAGARHTQGGYIVVEQPEITGLYPPRDAEATWVQCVTGDGVVSPVYVENRIISLPYQIAADKQMTQIGDSSFEVEINK